MPLRLCAVQGFPSQAQRDFRPCGERSPARGAAVGLRRWRGLCSNIWFWRCTTGVLAVVAVLILCIHLAVNSSSEEGSLQPCPADWLCHERKCYYLSEEEKDWNSSQSFCSSHNSSLVVIENHQELNFIMKITKQDLWIGLHKKGAEFSWVNGTPLDPNLLTVKDSKECAYIQSTGVSSSGCSLPRAWVCKKIFKGRA
uniref:C-type lectin domain-containing protein n=1 Tax=Pelusios castaneus TaxID=367368 RepID=A0A8C8S540_9SAUR